MMTSNEPMLAPAEAVADENAQEFKATGRRNRLLGLWAGGLMGLEDPHLKDYVSVIVRSDVVLPSDEDVIRKLAGDLAGSGLKITEDHVRGKMDELHAVARGQIQAGE